MLAHGSFDEVQFSATECLPYTGELGIKYFEGVSEPNYVNPQRFQNIELWPPVAGSPFVFGQVLGW